MSDIAQILIVDDDPHLRRAHARLLEKSGYRVLEAATGRDALRLAREARPDLILVDVVLPDIDGLEVCRRVKADETLAGIHVVLLSGVKTASENQAEGLEAGADGYIVRPISNRELVARVEALLRLGRVEEALRESEQRYRHRVEHSHEIICVHDLEGRILLVNQVAVDLLGYEQSALLGMNIRDVLAPDVRDEFDAYLATIREDGFVSGLMLVRTRAGEERMWEYDNALRTEGVPTPVVRAMAHDVTKQMRTQRALQESEERYRRLVEGSPDIIWTLSVEHGGMYTSAQVEEALGYSPDYLAQHPHLWRESIHPDDRDRVARALEDFAAGGKLDVEYRIRDSAGNWHWFRDRSIGRRVEDGEVMLDGISTDVTERKRAEEGLHHYTERLRALHAIDGTILAAWSPEEIARAALRHVRQLVPCLGAGVLRFDFEAREILLFAMDADGDVGVQEGTRLPLWGGTEVERLRRGNILVERSLPDVGQSEIEHRRSGPRAEGPNGGRSSPAIRALQAAGVRSYVGAPLIAYDELIGVLALASESPGAFTPDHVDVAREVANSLALALHQAHLRAALEAERGRLAALVEHLPEGILWLDGEWRLQLSNPVAEAYLPVLTDAGVGDVLSHLGERSLEELLQPPPEGVWRELEVAGPPRRIFEVAAQPMGRETEETEGWVVLVRDVTAGREARQRVQQQERLAAVGQLAGGIAHDFNNLLTTIMLYAQIPLGKPHLPPDLARAFETIVDESRRAAELVQQILDFSRRSPIQTRPVDLKPFFKEAVRVLERTIPESISLSLNMGPGKYVVNADPTRIQQVLMNLVLNARDAMPEGGELRVGLERTEGGEWVCLCVSDTGAGIPPEVMPHIFEPFFTTKPPGQGSGLGLAQVYGIVKQHGGHIRVGTEVGKGSSFHVYLPACQAEGEREVPEEDSAALRGRGETVLLVEDSERIREVGRRILESLGYRVLTARNGQDALAVYQAAEVVDLVVTDIVMPKMGGRRLVRRLREISPDLKAVGITGYGVPDDVQDAGGSGFLGVVRKPFDVETLGAVVRRALDADT